MNFRYISLIALISVAPVLAMDYSGHDNVDPKSKAAARLHAVEQHTAAKRLLAQGVKPKAAQRAQAERERDTEVFSTLGDAFGQLPNNKSRSEKEKKDFYAMIAARMPKAVQRYIGEFQGKSNADFINTHLMELIPSVIKKHGFYPSMRKLIEQGHQLLSNYFQDHAQQLVAREQPYIIAATGFWSFNDEPSKFRSRIGARNFSSDVNEWFRLTYPNNSVPALADNEWLAVLYSDGSIKWQTSALNKARLKKLTKEQLLLGVALWEQPDFLKANELEIYRMVPSSIKNAMQSNYDIASSQQAKNIRKMAKGVAGLGTICAAIYGIYGATSANLDRKDPSAANMLQLLIQYPGFILKSFGCQAMALVPFALSAFHTHKIDIKRGRSILQPTGWQEQFDFWCKVTGGGVGVGTMLIIMPLLIRHLLKNNGFM